MSSYGRLLMDGEVKVLSQLESKPKMRQVNDFDGCLCSNGLVSLVNFDLNN